MSKVADSSAIVKRYFQEPGHEWIEMLHDPAQGNGLYIAQAALVEVVASICRKAREKNMPRTRCSRSHPEVNPDTMFV
jgi:predicted nucleic acid-binding protein